MVNICATATWRIPLNRPFAAAMQPFGQITFTTCFPFFRSTPASRPDHIRGGLKCPSVGTSICTYVRTSVHPQKVFPISVKFGMYVEVNE